MLQMSAQSGVNLAPALLFVGCRSSTGDRLYAEEFDAWNNQGAVDVRYAFSREVEESYDCKYVQDRIAKDRVEVKDLWDKGAKVYICGTSQLVRGVGGILRQILFEGEEEKRATDSWLEATKGERVLTDVFG